MDIGGYTGIYSQFVNGPYGQLLDGTRQVNREIYLDALGDGHLSCDADRREAAQHQQNGNDQKYDGCGFHSFAHSLLRKLKSTRSFFSTKQKSRHTMRMRNGSSRTATL